MALEYRLTLAGDIPANVLAERALPDPDERPIGVPPILSASLFDRYGFLVTVRSGQNGYVEADYEDGTLEWEPKQYAAVGFRLDKFADRETLITNMVTIVRRVMVTGSEDAAFTFNGGDLIFARFDGQLVKHNREAWWSYHPAADQLIAES